MIQHLPESLSGDYVSDELFMKEQLTDGLTDTYLPGSYMEEDDISGRPIEPECRKKGFMGCPMPAPNGASWMGGHVGGGSRSASQTGAQLQEDSQRFVPMPPPQPPSSGRPMSRGRSSQQRRDISLSKPLDVKEPWDRQWDQIETAAPSTAGAQTPRSMSPGLRGFTP